MHVQIYNNVEKCITKNAYNNNNNYTYTYYHLIFILYNATEISMMAV